MDEVKKKNSSTGTDDENHHDSLFNLKRLKEGYGTIVDKMGYTKFKPYLHRLFNSVEGMLVHEITEFKKIDLKYQDIVRQCHIYEKTLTMMKENNCCEMSSFNESSNTYALDDLTKVTPFLAPDLLQSTMGGANGGSTSLHFRLPRQRSSLSNQHYVSTPLGPTRNAKGTVPIAKFDEDSSFALGNSLGFQQQPTAEDEKRFVDAATDPEPVAVIEYHDFSCQIAPICIDQEIETNRLFSHIQCTQTETVSVEHIACQINPMSTDCSMQTTLNEHKDFSCQIIPMSIDQTTETLPTLCQTQTIQTESINTVDCSSQISADCHDQQMETTPITTQDIALQTSFESLITFDDQQVQTDWLLFVDAETQYELEVETPVTLILPIVLSEELPISHEVEISFESVSIQCEREIFFDQQCQTNSLELFQINQSSQTSVTSYETVGTQSSIITCEDQSNQTETWKDQYSSSLYIVPTSTDVQRCSSSVLFIPREIRTSHDREVQCELNESIINVPMEIEMTNNITDRRSLIQQQLDEKEKQMNRIIEEYAILYGEYEGERRRNLDLTEARDRLADHIKILSDELGDREINQEKLIIKSCQQHKLINYMLPQIECSPMAKKKPHSATSFRRLLPKFK